MTIRRKIVQLLPMNSGGYTILVALCDDGTAWWRNPIDDTKKWKPYPLIMDTVLTSGE